MKEENNEVFEVEVTEENNAQKSAGTKIKEGFIKVGNAIATPFRNLAELNKEIRAAQKENPEEITVKNAIKEYKQFKAESKVEEENKCLKVENGETSATPAERHPKKIKKNISEKLKLAGLVGLIAANNFASNVVKITKNVKNAFVFAGVTGFVAAGNLATRIADGGRWLGGKIAEGATTFKGIVKESWENSRALTIAIGFAGLAFASAVGCAISFSTYIGQSVVSYNKCQSILEKYNYNEHNAAYQMEQLQSLDEQRENGDITDIEYLGHIKNDIKNLNKYEFILNNDEVSENDKAAYEKAKDMEVPAGTASVVLFGVTVASLAVAGGICVNKSKNLMTETAAEEVSAEIEEISREK